MPITSIIKLVFIYLVAGLILASCDEGGFMLGEYNQEKVPEVKKLISEELSVGSSSSDIESFFSKHGITYSYDEFSERYQAIIRDVTKNENMDHSVVIHINVDKEKNFVSSEVRDSFR